MDEPTQIFARRKIHFQNDRSAQMLLVPKTAAPSEIVSALGLEKPKALIIVAGARGNEVSEADEATRSRLMQLMGRALVRAAAEVGAAIIDSGTREGVGAIIGEGVAARGFRSNLIGVAPVGRVSFPGSVNENRPDAAPLEPNHSDFILLESETWGDETDLVFALVRELGKETPVLMVLMNGDEIAKQQVLRAVRMHVPVIVINGSGGLADQVAGLAQNKPEFVADPLLAEIISEGEIHIFPMDGKPEVLEQSINRHLGGGDILELAWQRCATYDLNSLAQQKNFRQMRKFILWLGVIATTLAISATQFEEFLRDVNLGPTTLYDLIHFGVILAPITLSVLIAAHNWFNPGSKYALLRVAAESIKGEIYSFRARAGAYSETKLTWSAREAQLEKRIESLSTQLLESDVKDGGLEQYTGPIPPRIVKPPDDGFSFLSGDRYVQFRLANQIQFYEYRVKKLDRERSMYRWLIYIAGGAGTLVAAVGWDIWIALTSALVASFTAYLEYMQVEFTLARSNQVLTDLQNIRAWWMTLVPSERERQENTDQLAGSTERVLDEQNAAWVGNMRDALAELRAQQEKERERVAGKK